MYVLALALVSLAWYGYRQAQNGLVGMALGSLLITKTAALMVWPLFLVQRHYRMLVWGAATMLVVAVGALPVTGSVACVTFMSKASDLRSSPLLAVTAFQTQWSFFRHLFVIADDPSHPTLTPLYPLVQHHLIALLELSTACEESPRHNSPQWVVENSAETQEQEHAPLPLRMSTTFANTNVSHRQTALPAAYQTSKSPGITNQRSGSAKLA